MRVCCACVYMRICVCACMCVCVCVCVCVHVSVHKDTCMFNAIRNASLSLSTVYSSANHEPCFNWLNWFAP